MKKILVTGGAGFIGSHTCLVLLQKGYEIFVIDSFINSSRESLKNVLKIIDEDKNSSFSKKLHVFEGDIRNRELLDDIFNKSRSDGHGNGIKGVIHFAGLKAVEESVNNPFLYWKSNIFGSVNLFDVMHKNNCHTLVFSSSASIYGKNLKEKIDENSLINPINPYGTTKMVIERLLEDLQRSFDLSWRIANLRYFNPIGAHQSGLIGENPVGIPNNIFPYITKVALGTLKEVRIFGDDWPTIDGTGVRDYIHVMDLAEGHIKALEFLFENKPNIINMNLGTGKGSSVLELINTFQNVNNVKIPYVFNSRRSGDVASLVANNSLAKKLLKWEPNRSLSQMCKDGWKWQFKNPEGY